MDSEWDWAFQGEQLDTGEWVALDSLLEQPDSVFGNELGVGVQQDQQHPGVLEEFTVQLSNGVGNQQSLESISGSSARTSSTSSTAKEGRAKQNAKAKRDTRNADACKRHREKRKRQVTELKERNSVLEQQREEYLARIADLQQKVEALRMNNQFDLSKENQLLRMEINKHKAFIMTVIDAASRPPRMTEEEQYRILKGGLESGKCQILGMCYSSLADMTWKELKPRQVQGIQVRVRYQMLPHGCKHDSCKRINYRMDFGPFNRPAQFQYELLWQWCQDLDLLNNSVYPMYEKIDNVSRRLEDILPDSLRAIAAQLEDEKVSCFRYTETGKRSDGVKETTFSTFATCGSQAELYSGGLVFGKQGLEDAVKVYVHCSTSVNRQSLMVEKEKDCEVKGRFVDLAVLKGGVFYSIPGEEETQSYGIGIGSIPLDGNSFKGLQRVVDRNESEEEAFIEKALLFDIEKQIHSLLHGFFPAQTEGE